SAVWSSKGNLLLFVTQEEPLIFSISFIQGEGVGGAQVASQVADLSKREISVGADESVLVGGPVMQLAWDPRSKRLAVIFRDTEFIVLLHTNTQPSLHLAPGGFIRGEPGHVPVTVGFHQNLSTGAVLSVVWSNGQIQHVPMRYASREIIDSSLNITSSVMSIKPHVNPNLSFSSTSVKPSLSYRASSPTSPITAALFTSPQ
ncbi:hypothetical protein SK128_019097, partial [Halocaridina rubra]